MLVHFDPRLTNAKGIGGTVKRALESDPSNTARVKVTYHKRGLKP